MPGLAFLADVHVKRAYVTAIRSSGYQTTWVDEADYDPEIDDAALLDRGFEENLVIVTNDADFVALANGTDHAGIIMFQQYGHTPRTFVRGVTRIDRHLTSDSFRNHVEWLENWL